MRGNEQSFELWRGDKVIQLQIADSCFSCLSLSDLDGNILDSVEFDPGALIDVAQGQDVVLSSAPGWWRLTRREGKIWIEIGKDQEVDAKFGIEPEQYIDGLEWFIHQRGI